MSGYFDLYSPENLAENDKFMKADMDETDRLLKEALKLPPTHPNAREASLRRIERALRRKWDLPDALEKRHRE